MVSIGQSILNYSEHLVSSERDQELDPQTFYERIYKGYQGDPLATRTNKKDGIQLQVYEMLKEIAGFKIAFNSLLYLCARFQKVVSDLRP